MAVNLDLYTVFGMVILWFIFTEMNHSAAFSVRLHEHTELSDSPCIFGTVDLNIGDGYDEFTGLHLFSSL